MTHFWHTPSLSDMEEQKRWELSGIERGVLKVRQQLNAQGVGDSAVGSALIQRIIPKLVVGITRLQDEAAAALSTPSWGGRAQAWWYLAMLTTAETLAVITLKAVLSSPPKDFALHRALLPLASELDRNLYEQIDFEVWREEDTEGVLSTFLANYKTSARNLKRLRERIGRARSEKWDRDAGIQFGVVLLNALAVSEPEWFSIERVRTKGRKTEVHFIFQQSVLDAISDLVSTHELSQPVLLPMICQPLDWRHTDAV